MQPETANAVARRREAIARRHPAWIETSLDRYLATAAGAFADRLLVVTDAVSMTYADVDADASAVARMLAAKGVRQGDRVALLMANYPITVPLLFGIWRAGATALPLNTLYRPDELRFVLQQARPRLLIAMTGFGSRDFRTELDAGLPAGTELIFFDAADPKRSPLEIGIEASGRAALPTPTIDPRSPAVIMYTSGTTGSPKGVVQTHDNLLRAAYAGAYHQAFDDGRSAIFSLPLYHAFGLVVGLLSGIVVGGSIIPLLRFDPRAILEGIGRHRATFLMGVPTMTAAMLGLAESEPFDLGSLTAVHSAAAPTPSWVWRRIQEVFGCEEIFTSWGQTEVTATIVCTEPGDPIDVVAVTQGRVVKGGVAGIASLDGDIAEFRIVDPATGEDMPDGMAGEIWTRGPLNSLGYLDSPAETAALFAEDGWLRTGDRGYFRPDGNMMLTGRIKELYKSRGELVSPKEIEEVITAHPDIREAYVIGMPDEQHGESGCAWLVAATATPPSPGDLIEYLSSRLPRYKLPRDVFYIDPDDLPKTGTGKVQKSLLRDRTEKRLAGARA